MFCCVCAGVCNHVGPHSFCAAHSGMGMTPVQPGQLNPPLQPTFVPHAHTACDQRIAELEKALAEREQVIAQMDQIMEEHVARVLKAEQLLHWLADGLDSLPIQFREALSPWAKPALWES